MNDFYNPPPGWNMQNPPDPDWRPEQPPLNQPYYPPAPPLPPPPPQNYYPWQPYYPPAPPPPYRPYYRESDRRGMAIASMILGIASVVICCVAWLSVICGVLGIVFGCLSLKSSGRNMAIAGIACGGAGLLILLFWIIMAFGLSIFNWNYWDYFY